MATFTASAAQATTPAKTLAVGLTVVKSVFSFDGISTSIGHTVHMVKCPARSTVTHLEYFPNVSGEYTLEVGDSVSSQRYRSNGTTSAGLGTQRPATLAMQRYQYSADDTIIMKISLASVLTLGGAFYMNVIFSMDA